MQTTNTYFAPAEKTSEAEIVQEIELLNHNPFISGLLHSLSGLLAVLDTNRQILAMNDSFLKMVGIDDPHKALGMRPGDVLQCIHAHDQPAGCGTTKYCSTCGAAIAIVSSLKYNTPVEKICALTANRCGKEVDVSLLVKSHPITIEGRRFLLLFLQDITQQQQWAALERTFFHDINNLLTMLVGGSELLVRKHPSKLAHTVHHASERIVQEIAIQRYLSQTHSHAYLPAWVESSTTEIMKELASFFANHPSAHEKHLEFAVDYPKQAITTDFSLLMRVLNNMVINALEAGDKQEVVKVWIDQNDADTIFFRVWNARKIPDDVSRRIFQRNFSTKEQAGRGIGTFSMKLLGEKILGGEVSFSTSEEEGTVFSFKHPVGA